MVQLSLGTNGKNKAKKYYMDFCNMKNVANFEPYEFQISEYYLIYKNYQFVWEAFNSSVPFFITKSQEMIWPLKGLSQKCINGFHTKMTCKIHICGRRYYTRQINKCHKKVTGSVAGAPVGLNVAKRNSMVEFIKMSNKTFLKIEDRVNQTAL